MRSGAAQARGGDTRMRAEAAADDEDVAADDDADDDADDADDNEEDDKLDDGFDLNDDEEDDCIELLLSPLSSSSSSPLPAACETSISYGSSCCCFTF